MFALDEHTFTHLRTVLLIVLAFAAGGGLAALIPTSGRAAPVLPECSDGIDNDGDGLIDLADPDCKSPLDPKEQPAGQPTTTTATTPPPDTTTETTSTTPPPPDTTTITDTLPLPPPPTTTTDTPPPSTTTTTAAAPADASPSGPSSAGAGTFVSTTSAGPPPLAPAPAPVSGSSSPPSVRPLGHLAGVAIVRLAGRLEYYGARITRLGVTAPAGSFVSVVCRGRTCGHRRRVTKRVRSTQVRIRLFERPLRAGTRLQVFVSKDGFVGKYTAFVIRRNRAPLRFDACLLPASRSPTSCGGA